MLPTGWSGFAVERVFFVQPTGKMSLVFVDKIQAEEIAGPKKTNIGCNCGFLKLFTTTNHFQA